MRWHFFNLPRLRDSTAPDTFFPVEDHGALLSSKPGRMLMLTKRKLALWGMFLFAMIIIGGTGCSSPPRAEGESAVDQLPWNRPAGWEGQVIGLPY